MICTKYASHGLGRLALVLSIVSQLFVVSAVAPAATPQAISNGSPGADKPADASTPGERSAAASPAKITAVSNTSKPADSKPASPLAKLAPESLDDLQSIQSAIQQTVKKAFPATVGVEVGERLGSGVIVTADGFVLTVGHISGGPGRDAFAVLPSGRVLRAKTLGALQSADAGMIKIVEPGPWPHVDLGNSSALNPGAWCVTLGYPRGFRNNHTPTVRAGRVISVGSDIWTDCPLIAGDSGGPLFDLQGRVIGIHNGIDDPLVDNYHTPVDVFRNSWSQLTAGERGSEPVRGGPALGLSGETQSNGCRVVKIAPGGSAEKAGVMLDDVVTHLSGESVDSIEALQVIVGKHKVGAQVTLSMIRAGQEIELPATLLKRE
jgi:serine protease Do